MRLSPLWLVEHGTFSTSLPLVLEKLASATLSEARAAGDENRKAQAAQEEKFAATIEAFSDYNRNPTVAEKPAKPYAMNGSVAVLNLKGAMTKSENCMSSFYGGASTEALQNLFEVAALDADVKSILLKVDSPGGNVDGTAELSNTIASVRAQKPVWTWVNGTMASAALWVGVQADYVYASSENALIGSLGVITAIADKSESAEYLQSGIKYYKIDTGPNKAPGAYFSPITEDQKAYIKAQVMQIGTAFAAAVSEQRGIDLKIGVGTADGSMFLARDAQDRGLIDGVVALNDVLAEMNSRARTDMGSLRKSSQAATIITNTAKETITMPNDDIRNKPGIDAAAPDAETVGLFKRFLNALTGAEAKIEAEAKTLEAAAEADLAVAANANAILAPLFAAAGLAGDKATPEALTALIGSTIRDSAVLDGLKKTAGVDAAFDIDALIKDGIVGRTSAFDGLAKNMNRVLGAGTITPEKIAEQYKGKSLTEINAAIAPYLNAGDAKFAAKPDATDDQDAGRATTGAAADASILDGTTQAEKDVKAARRAKLEAGMGSIVAG